MSPNPTDFPTPSRDPGAEPLPLGTEHVECFEVEGRLLTDVGGTIGGEVLSTPGMVAMMERTAAVLAYGSLPEGSATVGFEVCIKHVGAAAKGARCRARAKLVEVVEDRKLHFEVEVTEGERTIGVGTHQRRVIEAAGHGSEDD